MYFVHFNILPLYTLNNVFNIVLKEKVYYYRKGQEIVKSCGSKNDVNKEH